MGTLNSKAVGSNIKAKIIGIMIVFTSLINIALSGSSPVAIFGKKKTMIRPMIIAPKINCVCDERIILLTISPLLRQI